MAYLLNGQEMFMCTNVEFKIAIVPFRHVCEGGKIIMKVCEGGRHLPLYPQVLKYVY